MELMEVHMLRMDIAVIAVVAMVMDTADMAMLDMEM